ncbi:hypothetical protein I204_05704 [Kwoniella mangroviensis CBS 8886]|uniref:uncharacterized protein n=1 Tax=Kwoniella mangroviensis CBS 8507 TaxID=1296122 RepID=UPI00080D6F5F|nr:uncharacterized protein I203_06917 [Kwoniella mangroviensis CBS 8507]OCF63961.1 hypothetical protein I203_06917 [Kwoniella mangroviensis CBS 8507]OCF73859.1 hypothetical protein I204_05704 [Kwoniella mangroviensis CBS 8886]
MTTYYVAWEDEDDPLTELNEIEGVDLNRIDMIRNQWSRSMPYPITDTRWRPPKKHVPEPTDPEERRLFLLSRSCMWCSAKFKGRSHVFCSGECHAHFEWQHHRTAPKCSNCPAYLNHPAKRTVCETCSSKFARERKKKRKAEKEESERDAKRKGGILAAYDDMQSAKNDAGKK